MPMMPALFDCSARTVYVPSANGFLDATAQLPPEAVVARVCTGEPETPNPEKTSTVIFDESRGAVPAAPEKAGLRSCVVLPLIGFLTVTAGATRGTVHDMCAGVRSAAPDGADRAHAEGVRSTDKRGVTVRAFAREPRRAVEAAFELGSGKRRTEADHRGRLLTEAGYRRSDDCVWRRPVRS